MIFLYICVSRKLHLNKIKLKTKIEKGATGWIVIAQIAIGQHFLGKNNCATKKNCDSSNQVKKVLLTPTAYGQK